MAHNSLGKVEKLWLICAKAKITSVSPGLGRKLIELAL
jgi:hypothetical protein